MIDVIAAANEVACYNVLNGFKWISSLIKEKKERKITLSAVKKVLVLMIGDKIRDKDSVSAVNPFSVKWRLTERARAAAFSINSLISMYNTVLQRESC